MVASVDLAVDLFDRLGVSATQLDDRDTRVARELAEVGFCAVRQLLSPALLDALLVAVDGLSYASGGPYGAICHDPWRRDPTFFEAAAQLDLGGLARAACGVELRWFQDHIIDKPPGGAQAIAWHQDYSYWPLDRPTGVTLWIALDDAGDDAGCLEYASGTHAGGERRPADFTAGAAQPRRPGAIDALEAIDETAADHAAVAVPARRGDLLIHDPLVWHRSKPNRSARRRRAWSISLCAADARWDPDHAPHPFVTAGFAVAGARLDAARFPRLT